jgi:hypothetical protein
MTKESTQKLTKIVSKLVKIVPAIISLIIASLNQLDHTKLLVLLFLEIPKILESTCPTYQKHYVVGDKISEKRKENLEIAIRKVFLLFVSSFLYSSIFSKDRTDFWLTLAQRVVPGYELLFDYLILKWANKHKKKRSHKNCTQCDRGK